MTAEQQIADALRAVTLRLEEAFERGRRAKDFDANDLLETPLSVADQLDRPVPEAEPTTLEPPY